MSNDYFIRIAKNPDHWVRGLTMTNGGQNLIDMAQDFEHRAQEADETSQVAFLTLAAALRKHVEQIRAFYQKDAG